MRLWRLPPVSIRVRLTAWYVLLLAALLALLGIFVLRLVEERLHAETANRLRQTAGDVQQGLKGGYEIVWTDESDPTLRRFALDLTPYGSHGQQMIQVVDARNRVIDASPYTPTDVSLAPDWTARPDGEPEFSTTTVNGIETRVLWDPIIGENRRTGVTYTIGAVVVGESLQGLHDSLGALRQTLLLTSGAGLLLALAGGWVLADRVLRPVDRVTAAAARIAAGDGSAASLGTRLAVPITGDELARLSATFNAMLDRLEASFHAQQRFVADASHELRTPLTAVRGNVDVMARQLAGRNGQAGNDDLVAALNDVQRESARMGRLVDDLLLLARSDGGVGGAANGTTNGSANGAAAVPERRQPVDLATIARDAVRSASGLADGQVLSVVAPRPVVIDGDPDRLTQLLLILLDNAVRHTPAGKAITVEGAPDGEGMARLAVRDEGEGIAPAHLPHVFDRFYRADGARGRATGGTGLGLAIARVIAASHGGTITVTSEPGQGSEFVVRLPRPPRPATARTEAESARQSRP